MSKFSDKALDALEEAADHALSERENLLVWLVTAFVVALLEIADAIRYSER